MVDGTLIERIKEQDKKDYPFFVKHKKVTRWSIFGVILLSASLMIFYIYNVRRINYLLSEIRLLEDKYKIIRMDNTILRAKVNELEGPDRIIRLAEEALSMRLQDRVPVLINN